MDLNTYVDRVQELSTCVAWLLELEEAHSTAFKIRFKKPVAMLEFFKLKKCAVDDLKKAYENMYTPEGVLHG